MAYQYSNNVVVNMTKTKQLAFGKRRDEIAALLKGFKDLRILTVVALYIQEVIMFADMNELPRGTDVHQYNTRHADNFILPAHHLSLYGRKSSYMGRKLYNLLPIEIKTQKVKNLMMALNRWLVTRPY
ncbi:hypothetical protein J6590_077009 [Homalodisca vitripennis]|nr:hypothetical protein J6590_077009 [Homalodisca vitripennis]